MNSLTWPVPQTFLRLFTNAQPTLFTGRINSCIGLMPGGESEVRYKL